MPDVYLQKDDVFGKRYRVTEELGHGGFAAVYRAEQLDLGRDVAVKILLPGKIAPDADSDEQPDEESIEQAQHHVARRFKREARLLSQLRDPHTVTVFDYGETPDGLLYMVLEYVDGIDLDELLHTNGSLSSNRTVKILRQVLSSLQEAHARGVLHRDLKPGNIMIYEHLGETDQVKLIDFGIAGQLVGRGKDFTQELTDDDMMVGTPRYMSPEQIQGDDLSPASDLYGLGLVTYEMLTGQKAIPGENAVQVIGEQVHPNSVKLPQQLDIPTDLRLIVDKLLEKNLEARFQSTDEVIEALDHLDLEAESSRDGDDHQTLRDLIDAPPAQKNSSTSTADTTMLEEPPVDPHTAADESGRSSDVRATLLVAASLASVALGLLVSLLAQSDVSNVVMDNRVSRYLAGSGSTSSAPATPNAESGDRNQNAKDDPGSGSPNPNQSDGESIEGVGNDDDKNRESNLANTDKTDDEVKLIQPPPTEEELEIITTPPDLKIWVNGERFGRSPVGIKRKKIEFPAHIVAEKENGLREEATLSRYRERIRLEFEDRDYSQTSVLERLKGRKKRN